MALWIWILLLGYPSLGLTFIGYMTIVEDESVHIDDIPILTIIICFWPLLVLVVSIDYLWNDTGIGPKIGKAILKALSLAIWPLLAPFALGKLIGKLKKKYIDPETVEANEDELEWPGVKREDTE